MTSQKVNKFIVALICTGFFLNVLASRSVRILMKDEGAYEQNITKPRIVIKNTGTEAICNFIFYFYFSVDDGRAPVIEPWYTPNSTVTLENLSSQLYRVKYDFIGVTLLPGAQLPDAGGNIIGMHYADYSTTWNKTDDFSYNNSAIFIENQNIPVYVNGTKIYGNEPTIPSQPAPRAVPIASYYYILSQFAVFGSDRVGISDFVNITDGSIGSNMYAEIGCESQIKGDVVSKGQIFLRERCTVTGDIIAGALTTRQNTTTIAGLLVDSAAIDLGNPIIHNVTPGSLNVTIPDGQSLTIEPGSYSTIHAFSHARLTFKAGSYAIGQLLTEPDGQIIFQLNAGEEINLDIAGEARFADRLQMGFSATNYPAAVHIYSNYSGQITIGTDATIYGILVAPTASVVVASRTNVHGAIYANRVTIEPQTTVCKPPLLADLAHSEWAYAPSFDPLVMQYHAFVPDATYSITITPTALNSANSVSVNGGSPANPVNLDEIPKDILVRVFGGECGMESNYRLRVERSANPIIYVNDDSPCTTGDCDGTAWESAFKDLQQALAASRLSGKEIWVAEGTYKPTALKNPPDRDATFQLTPGIELIGGFKGTETTNVPNGSPYATILIGDIAGNDGSAWPPATADIAILTDNVYHVVTVAGNKKSRSTKITGFTIQGGVANGDGINAIGGGLFVQLSHPHIELCRFHRNISKMDGAGMYCGSVPLVLNNCLWEKNVSLSGNGGGLYMAGNQEDEFLISSSIFDGNAAKDGGGFYASSNDVRLENCIIVNNHATNDGGGLYSAQKQLTLINCTITANSAGLWTGGVSNRSQMKVTFISNTILWSNVGGDSVAGRAPYLRDIDGKQLSITYSFTSVPMAGEGNIAGDPQFVNSPLPKGTDGKYGTDDDGLQLGQVSQCRDAGEEANAPSVDILQMSRPWGVTVDMGAYEYQEYHVQTGILGYLTDGGYQSVSVAPILKHIYREHEILLYAMSKYGLVMRLAIPKNKYTQDRSSGYLYVQSKTASGDYLPGSVPVKIQMYKVSEDKSNCYFQSKTLSGQGKEILLVNDNDYQNNSNMWAYVIYATSTSQLETLIPYEQ
jgi:hypothetical protein